MTASAARRPRWSFWCYMAGDDGWNRLPVTLRERLRSGATTLFEIELVSADGLPGFAEIASRLGERLGVDIAASLRR